MTIGIRAALVMTAVATVAIAFAELAIRFTLHARLGTYAPSFEMMRSMMGDGPDLAQIYGEIDRTILWTFGFATMLAIVTGVAFGATLARSLRAVNRGLAFFAQGRLEEPIRERGPLEMRLVARNANTMASQLAANRAAERELVAGVVHDLAHPITALRATVDAIDERLLDANDPSITRRLLEAVATLEATTNDLRDVAAWATGSLELKLTDVDIESLAHRVATMYEDYAARRGVTLRVASEVIRVRSDLRRLERLVDNLVVNAIQATAARGTVSFWSGHRDGVATIRISDEAGESGTARLAAALHDGEGSGLGLRVVHAMAQSLGARLAVTPSEGGSTVNVALEGPMRGARPL